MPEISYSCPICYGGDRPDPREGYTVCYDCQKTGIRDTPFGDTVKFYNTHISGGIGAKVVRAVPEHIIRTTGTERVSQCLIRETETGEEDYDSRICFVKGVRCYATEARFGGIVISKCQDQTGALSEDQLRVYGWYHKDPNQRVVSAPAPKPVSAPTPTPAPTRVPVPAPAPAPAAHDWHRHPTTQELEKAFATMQGHRAEPDEPTVRYHSDVGMYLMPTQAQTKNKELEELKKQAELLQARIQQLETAMPS